MLDGPRATPYAGAMHESNPDPSVETHVEPAPAAASDGSEAPLTTPDVAPATSPILDELAVIERRAAVLHGLRVWFGLIAGLGLLSLIANMGELAFMVVLGAVFVAAHAADQDESFEKLRLVLSAIFVIGA